jgi:hypothetical protein
LIRNRGPAGREADGDTTGEAAGADDSDGDTDGAEDGAEEAGDDLAQPDRARRTIAMITAIGLSTGSR